MYFKILAGIKTFFICLLLFTASYAIYDAEKYTKVKADQTLSIAVDTRKETLQAVADLRKDAFDYLNSTNKAADDRLGSIQKDLNIKLDKTNEILAKAESDANDQLTVANKTLSDTAVEYSKIPKEVDLVASRFDVQTDCTKNELCWQNMFSDLMIDSRNTARDGAENYRELKESIPLIVKNVQTVTDAIAKAAPEVSENVKKTTDHIQTLTTPKWYDKIISYAISGGFMYFAARPTK